MKKICIYFQTGTEYGEGHKYRSLEVVEAAKRRGLEAEAISNDDSTRLHFTPNKNERYRGVDYGRWKMWMNKINADVMIFDLPHKPKDYMIDYFKQKGVKIANLNGPGWAEQNGLQSDQSWADFVWVQDEPDKIILRRDLRHVLREPVPNSWFVFGGSSDLMNLLGGFEQAIQRDPAILVGTKLRDDYTPLYEAHRYVKSEGSQIWQYMRTASRACAAMGIIAWECAAIGLPQYIFSRSPAHLQYSKRIEEYGLGLAYPEVGLPDGKNMRDFFKKTMALDIHNRPDCRGADRFIEKLMKEK